MMSPMEQTQYYNTTMKELTFRSNMTADDQSEQNNCPKKSWSHALKPLVEAPFDNQDHRNSPRQNRLTRKAESLEY